MGGSLQHGLAQPLMRGPLLLVVFGLVVFGLVVVPAPAVPLDEAAADEGGPRIHTPSPRPGEVTGAGETIVQVVVDAEAPLESVEVTVDGVALGAPQVVDEGARTTVSAAATVPDGARTVEVAVEDAGGRRASRTWSFHATERATTRLAGATRLETAVEISRAVYLEGETATAAVLARADDFADALTGTVLAAAVDGPLLLTHRDTLASVTAAELTRLLSTGGTVHLLGGVHALGAGVGEAVEALGFRVERHAGADRFATAAAVAGVLPPSSQAVLASGTSFPDALAASAPAARDGVPILLTAAASLPATTAEALAAHDVEQVTVIGGAAAVSEAVLEEVEARVQQVQRVAGVDRYGTAVAVLQAFYDAPVGVAMASGTVFADALTGARHAAAGAEPLLLAHRSGLPEVTASAVRSQQPNRLTVYGGATAVDPHVEQAALRAAVSGPNAPRLAGTQPRAFATVPYLDAVTVSLDRPVDPARSSVYVEIGGVEMPGSIVEGSPTDTLTVELADTDASWLLDEAWDGRLVLAASENGRDVAYDEVSFTHLRPQPLFATTGPVELHLPSRHVEMVGFHEANHRGAQQLAVRETATPKLTLPTRHRGTGSRSAADIVASPDEPVLAPVTGRVLRAGAYVLYCRYSDDFAVIEPDSRPGWEVKVLHFTGLQVRPGDRVEAGRTVIGAAPRALPFRSQVDRYSDERDWPHLHVEVVDPSVPTPPGSGC